ncbi:hypothetical protein SEA_RUDY_70 [Microbacterium phage Rudy]|nr:hypothetical protein SEA_CASEND_73 [Microbacterium phage Casend]QQO39252.1 hypothetical protein SEA_RUDY_70 [Microbacterium phage Rudy]QQO39581.1 hypothetical protein SEA_PHABIA_72 [Microbacterium phage Phabia]QWY80456.1 hypothetical protein SEA_TEEHEE_73 [Microbacterium phage Teehee]QWY80557.1 hypothetical protein SEA_QUAMMI_71 [Microbacterium phage Quammi]QXN73467.1 hypothetical protein SEA_JEHOSHAPHAT_74 [Microbacterium phage Jehoshaphat]UVG33916.1 hypothetical protein SEA_VICEROY_71 [M
MATRGRPRGAKAIPWDRIVARLREHPNRWLLLPEMAKVNARTVMVIRKRERRALRLDDGVIRCRIKAGYVDETGAVIATLYLKFDTKEKT